MKIKKTFQGELPENRVVNAKSNSATDAYSANYLNDKLRNVVVSPTEPTTGEDVWIKRSSNILKFDDFEKTVNGITFTMKDQVLHVEGTATAYTQECYLPINLTLEEAMTLTVDWDDDNLVPKAAYTYNGTSYYPNLYSQELEPGTYLNQLYFIIASGATVNTDVRFQLEKGRGFSGWQPVMEKAILVKNDNDVYEDLIKKSIHIGVDKPKNGEEVWIQKGKNLLSAPYTEENKVTHTALQNDHGIYTPYKCYLEAGQTYTMSFESDSDGANVEMFLIGPGSGNYFRCDGTVKQMTFTVNVTGYYTLRYDVNYLGETYSFWNFQVEAGSKKTVFELYIDKKIYTKNENGAYEEFYDGTHIVEGQIMPTNEYCGGKRVYVKRIYLGNLPNSSDKTVSCDIDLDTINVVRKVGIARSTSNGNIISLPYVFYFDGQIETCDGVIRGVYDDILITSNTDLSYFEGYYDLYFTYKS